MFLPVRWQATFPYDVWQPGANIEVTTELWSQAADFATDSEGIFVRLMKLFGVYSFTNDGENPQSAVAYIQYIINMLLGLAAFIALIILLYGFYLMFFSKQQEWFEKAKKIVIGVLVALVIMWLSWIVIRFLFFLYSLIQ